MILVLYIPQIWSTYCKTLWFRYPFARSHFANFHGGVRFFISINSKLCEFESSYRTSTVERLKRSSYLLQKLCRIRDTETKLSPLFWGFDVFCMPTKFEEDGQWSICLSESSCYGTSFVSLQTSTKPNIRPSHQPSVMLIFIGWRCAPSVSVISDYMYANNAPSKPKVYHKKTTSWF